MSKRRQPGEIVKRKPGTGFISSKDPELVKVPEGKAFEYGWRRSDDGKKWEANPGGEASICIMACGDQDCKEYANLEVMSGPFKGDIVCHLSECDLI